MVTIIADNYFGYCKKEVKTQISFAANLFGTVRGGARRRRDRVRHLRAGRRNSTPDRTVSLRARPRSTKRMRLLGDRVEQQPEGYAVDRNYPERLLRSRRRLFQRARGLRPLARDGERASI